MKLSEHIKACQELLDVQGDLECYYAIDDEGNGYQQLGFHPSVYYTNALEHRLGLIYTENDKEEYPDDHFVAICIIN